MTLAQVTGTLAAVAREEKLKLRHALIASRAANADKSSFDKLMRSLDPDKE